MAAWYALGEWHTPAVRDHCFCQVDHEGFFPALAGDSWAVPALCQITPRKSGVHGFTDSTRGIPLMPGS
jgi:hypothetical protein